MNGKRALQLFVMQMLIANILLLVEMEFASKLMVKIVQIVQQIVLVHFMAMNLIIVLIKVAHGVHDAMETKKIIWELMRALSQLQVVFIVVHLPVVHLA